LFWPLLPRSKAGKRPGHCRWVRPPRDLENGLQIGRNGTELRFRLKLLVLRLGNLRVRDELALCNAEIPNVV